MQLSNAQNMQFMRDCGFLCIYNAQRACAKALHPNNLTPHAALQPRLAVSIQGSQQHASGNTPLIPAAPPEPARQRATGPTSSANPPKPSRRSGGLHHQGASASVRSGR